ncbi:MAG: cation:dicarboxylate symporter family transporter [Vicinamibacterales bacterium]
MVSTTNPEWAGNFRPFSQLFLRMIKMIIAPLIFATLVAGIVFVARRDLRRAGRRRRADGR